MFLKWIQEFCRLSSALAPLLVSLTGRWTSSGWGTLICSSDGCRWSSFSSWKQDVRLHTDVVSSLLKAVSELLFRADLWLRTMPWRSEGNMWTVSQKLEVMDGRTLFTAQPGQNRSFSCWCWSPERSCQSTSWQWIPPTQQRIWVSSLTQILVLSNMSELVFISRDTFISSRIHHCDALLSVFCHILLLFF